MFGGKRFLLLQPGLSKHRSAILKSQIEKNGGHVTEEDDDATHALAVPCESQSLRKRGQAVSRNVPVINVDWVSRSLLLGQLAPVDQYEMHFPDREHKVCNSLSEAMGEPQAKVQKLNDKSTPSVGIIAPRVPISHDSPELGSMWEPIEKSSDENDEYLVQRLLGYDPKKLPAGNWVCTQSSKQSLQDSGHSEICRKLGQLADSYESLGDKWRVYAYRKAIGAVKVYRGNIDSLQTACSIPGVGMKIGEKIWELVESGSCSKLENMATDEKVTTMALFTQIWGVGVATAEAWYYRGLRTLEDVREKATLNKQQKIGLELYDDLKDRMARSEAAAIEEFVRTRVVSIDSSASCVVCGSFRRGSPTCGDIDLLITTPDGVSQGRVLGLLLNQLRQEQFLTHDLTSVGDGPSAKYMGVCRLPGFKLHRRIDMIAVPYAEYPCALVYFTGSAYFNRSLRLLAQRRGMSLNEHALRRNVTRTAAGRRSNQEKLNQGELLQVSSEQHLFTLLGVPFRPPEERDW